MRASLMEGFLTTACVNACVPDEETTSVTVVLPERHVDAIDSQLTYGDARSEWVREAIRRRLDDEAIPADAQ